MGFLDDYEPVEDRLREFWADHPDGRINTVLEAHSAENGYIVKASVWRQGIAPVLTSKEGDYIYNLPDATGYAHDSEATLPPNMKASALEVCETSAIGRALANLGYAAKGKRPSREEMSKVRPGEEVGRGDSSDAAPSSRAQGTASDRSGEGQANPGEGGAPQPSPEHHFPVDPAKCDHKTAAGKWVPWQPYFPHGVETLVCPKCGTPKITAMEGTTADLGPA